VSIPGRQHQDRRPDAPLPQLTAGGEPVDPRKHHVEHDRVVRRSPGHPERLLTARREVSRVTLLAEAADEQPPKLRLVLDDQDAHSSHSCSRKMSAA
jgi:hypothetical protein